MLPDYRRTILEKLRSTAGLRGHRRQSPFESHLTPEDIDRRYHVLNGAIYGLASHGRFFGGFKPANRSRDVQGLYLAGGAVHPGPGMPMVLMSGWIAADTLDQDTRQGTHRSLAVRWRRCDFEEDGVLATALNRITKPWRISVRNTPPQAAIELSCRRFRRCWRAGFAWYVARYVRRHFNAVRVCQRNEAGIPGSGRDLLW